MTDEHEPSEATREADRADAKQPHVADTAATPEEEDAAERGRVEAGADERDVAAHYEEMSGIGADVKGEGEI